MADLVEGLDSLIPRRAARHQQHPHLFHRPVAGLGAAGRLARQRRPGSGDRVGRVGLALAVPQLTVGTIDLDDVNAVVG